MPNVIFSHPAVPGRDLVVTTGMDDISWGYNLNTVTYPTYGGEVIQILSAYTDAITVGGTIQKYSEMEEIYTWFLTYMQAATQGINGVRYNQEPVSMSYPERGWHWNIWPRSLPGFRYGREVTAPEWRMQADVYDDNVHALNLQAAADGLEKLTAGIGYKANNPFSDPFPDGQEDFKKGELEKYYTDAGGEFDKIIKAYMEHDFDSLLGEIGSAPKFMDGKAPATPGTEEKPAGKKKRD